MLPHTVVLDTFLAGTWFLPQKGTKKFMQGNVKRVRLVKYYAGSSHISSREPSIAFTHHIYINQS